MTQVAMNGTRQDIDLMSVREIRTCMRMYNATVVHLIGRLKAREDQFQMLRLWNHVWEPSTVVEAEQ